MPTIGIRPKLKLELPSVTLDGALIQLGIEDGPQRSAKIRPRGFRFRTLVCRALTLAALSCAAEHAPLAQSALFEGGIEFGRVLDERIDEASGAAASRNNPGVLWIHNDGSADHLFAIGTDGSLLGIYELDSNPEDLEDIATGPGPIPGIQYIYAADIGDNLFDRDAIGVIRFPEPSVYSHFASSPVSAKLKGETEIRLIYPDGSHDAEAMMIDPRAGDLFLATKEFGFSQVFRAGRTELEDGKRADLTLVSEILIGEVSGADISSDGSEIMIRNEDTALLWKRQTGETVSEALRSDPIVVPLTGPPVEPNGEGIAFDPNGLGFYTVSEGVEQPLFFFERINPSIAPTRVVLIADASQWRYLDDGSNQGFAWRSVDFNDQLWPVGLGQFGYGEDDERTILRFGSDSDRKTITSYFRKTFRVPDASAVASLTLAALYDDGIAAYLNGTEVLRSKLAAGAPFSEQATASNSDLENVWITYSLDPAVLRDGANLLAVEVHRRSRSEGDLSFDAQLKAELEPQPLRFNGLPSFVAERWQFKIQGPTGSHVAIESSENLSDWKAIGSLALPSGYQTFIDPNPSNERPRFYRLRM